MSFDNVVTLRLKSGEKCHRNLPTGEWFMIKDIESLDRLSAEFEEKAKIKPEVFDYQKPGGEELPWTSHVIVENLAAYMAYREMFIIDMLNKGFIVFMGKSGSVWFLTKEQQGLYGEESFNI